jgi:hypothetical protein
MAWLAPVPRPALAVATIVAALVVSALAVTRPWQPRPSVIRGTPRIELALDAPRYDSDGGVRLSWRGSPGSESYVVRFFSVGLEPIGEVPAGPESALNLSPSQLPQTFSRGESVLYRVVALRGGDELATSAAGTIRKP